jgi:Spy/CpxP family protein refolding chaperone
MKRTNLRRTVSTAVLALISGTIVGASALADPPQDAYSHGYGMGGGMMGGYAMGGDEMLGGYGPRADLNLTTEQRSKIAKIQDDVRRKRWDLMGKMQDERSQMNEQFNAEPRDDAALSASYRKMSELRQQMFDLSLVARKQMDAVLSAEQREKMKHG